MIEITSNICVPGRLSDITDNSKNVKPATTVMTADHFTGKWPSLSGSWNESSKPSDGVTLKELCGSVMARHLVVERQKAVFLADLETFSGMFTKETIYCIFTNCIFSVIAELIVIFNMTFKLKGLLCFISSYLILSLRFQRSFVWWFWRTLGRHHNIITWHSQRDILIASRAS